MLILVEGQTEERFVKDVLAPRYAARGLYIQPTLLTTKRVKDGPDFKGGVTSFGKFEKDLKNLLRSGAWITTLLDYYGLPMDFPGMRDYRGEQDARAHANHIHNALRRHFSAAKCLIPFIAVHEFEAWLFSDDQALPTIMSRPDLVAEMRRLIDGHDSPEHINNGVATAPSKRLGNLFPGYRKTLHGPLGVRSIGLETIRAKCPHMSDWLDCLDAVPVG